jgi:uncharacterized protein YneR
MEKANNGYEVEAMWYGDNTVIILQYPGSEDEAWSNRDQLAVEAFALARSNFSDITLTNDTDSMLTIGAINQWDAYAVLEDSTVFIDHEPVWVFANSIIIRINSETKLELPETQSIFIVNNGSWVKGKSFGTGSNKYEVTAVLRDEYTIEVEADSEEEANRIAYDIDLSEWHHNELDTDLNDRVLIRMARWGNLSSRKVG